MPSIHYNGESYYVRPGVEDSLRAQVVDLANSGRYDCIQVGEGLPTRLLVGPGIPITFDQNDPPRR